MKNDAARSVNEVGRSTFTKEFMENRVRPRKKPYPTRTTTSAWDTTTRPILQAENRTAGMRDVAQLVLPPQMVSRGRNPFKQKFTKNLQRAIPLMERDMRAYLGQTEMDAQNQPHRTDGQRNQRPIYQIPDTNMQSRFSGSMPQPPTLDARRVPSGMSRNDRETREKVTFYSGIANTGPGAGTTRGDGNRRDSARQGTGVGKVRRDVKSRDDRPYKAEKNPSYHAKGFSAAAGRSDNHPLLPRQRPGPGPAALAGTWQPSEKASATLDRFVPSRVSGQFEWFTPLDASDRGVGQSHGIQHDRFVPYSAKLHVAFNENAREGVAVQGHGEQYERFIPMSQKQHVALGKNKRDNMSSHGTQHGRDMPSSFQSHADGAILRATINDAPDIHGSGMRSMDFRGPVDGNGGRNDGGRAPPPTPAAIMENKSTSQSSTHAKGDVVHNRTGVTGRSVSGPGRVARYRDV
jgi:hypothetical protein